MIAMGPAAAASRTLELPSECDRRLAQFLRQVDENDMVWLDEIYEEAVRMFVRYPHPAPLLGPAPTGRPPRWSRLDLPFLSSNYSEELELMPKTPSQKKRQRRKRLSALQEEEQEPDRKR